MILPATLIALMAATGVDQLGGAITAQPASITMDERDPAHPRYKDCAPPESFAKRFAKIDLEKAVKRSHAALEFEKPGVLESKNPVSKVGAASGAVYAKKALYTHVSGRDHTYAYTTRNLDGENDYFMMVSNSHYSFGSKTYISLDIFKICVKTGAGYTAIDRTTIDETGTCDVGPIALDTSCESKVYASFRVPPEIYHAFAESDPAKMIPVTTAQADGTLSACPLYYAPLSFKAPLIVLEAKYPELKAKREKQRAEGF